MNLRGKKGAFVTGFFQIACVALAPTFRSMMTLWRHFEKGRPDPIISLQTSPSIHISQWLASTPICPLRATRLSPRSSEPPCGSGSCTRPRRRVPSFSYVLHDTRKLGLSISSWTIQDARTLKTRIGGNRNGATVDDQRRTSYSENHKVLPLQQDASRCHRIRWTSFTRILNRQNEQARLHHYSSN